MPRTAAKTEPAATSAFIALIEIEHDLELYAPGAAIELTAAAAAPLLAVKAIEAGSAEADAPAD